MAEIINQQEIQQPDPEQVEQVEDSIINEDNAEISPAQQMQIDAYSDNATMVIFSGESQDAILQSLQTGKNPMDAVAKTANIINKRLQESLQKEGEQMTEITLCLGAAHMVSELVVLADAAGLFKMTVEQRAEAYRQTLMQYFAAGLKDGSIDPVELQKTIEPLMSQEQRQAGQDFADKSGMMKTPPANSGMFRGNQQQEHPQRQGILGGM